MMASNRVAFFHTGLDASDTKTSKYMSSVPYCRRLALMFSSGPRHFWSFLLDLPRTWMKKWAVRLTTWKKTITALRLSRWIQPKLTSAMNCVVINVSSTDVGSKLRAGYQQASWNRGKKCFAGWELPKSALMSKLIISRVFLPVPTKGSKTRSFFLTLAWLAMINDKPASILVFPMKCLFLTLWERISSRCPSAICHGNRLKKAWDENHFINQWSIEKKSLISPIGQSRHGLVGLGCHWGPCHNLPIDRKYAAGSSNSLSLQMVDSPEPLGENCTQTQKYAYHDSLILIHTYTLLHFQWPAAEYSHQSSEFYRQTLEFCWTCTHWFCRLNPSA